MIMELQTCAKRIKNTFMKKLNLFFSFYLLLSFTVFSVISCSTVGCSTKCKPNYTVEQGTLQNLDYLIKSKAVYTDNKSEEIEVYIDYSDGMHPAIESCNGVFDEVLNLVLSEKTRYLVCGRSDDLQPLTRAELDSKFDPKSTKSFIEDISILDKPLDRIVKEGKQAVYVTDFELTGTPKLQNVQGGTVLSSVDLSPDWATIYFDKWLAAGNSIDVFAKPFVKKRTKGMQNQYLYFLIFTPRSVTENRIVEGLAKLQNTDPRLEHLAFSKSRFQAVTAYTDAAQHGLNENVGLRDYITGQGYEYYKIKFDDLKRLDKLENKSIVEKLFFNQQLEGFSNLTFRAQVEDITAAYHLLADSMQCGSGTGLDKLKLTSTIEPNYFELKTKVLADGRIEFTIKKHDSYTAATNQLFKISILFDQVDYKPDVANMEKVLQWRDANLGQLVPGLYGGLKQAASRMDLKKTPIYTYYIEVE